MDSSIGPDVNLRPLFENKAIPVVIEPRKCGVDIVSWAKDNQAFIDQLICQHGALLFRGFSISHTDVFSNFVNASCPTDWVDYREASTPRSQVSGHVFTSTEYPASLRIYVHNENSHVTSWPLYLFFCCQIAPQDGGETPIADCREIYRNLPKSLIDTFNQSGWLYQRNFTVGSSITWQKAFGTNVQSEVENYCKENYMVSKWTSKGLVVRYKRWASLNHPRTGDAVWFNHGTFFNPYTIDPSLKKLAAIMGPHQLPYCTYYGDGSAICDEVMQTLDDAYVAETASFSWMAGDILMLDNMRIAHGRSPYVGERKVVVGMKWNIRCEEVADFSQYDPTCIVDLYP